MQAFEQEALRQVHVQVVLSPEREHKGRFGMRSPRALPLLTRHVQAVLP